MTRTPVSTNRSFSSIFEKGTSGWNFFFSGFVFGGLGEYYIQKWLKNSKKNSLVLGGYMVYRGVSTQLPLIKIIGISIFNKSFFPLLFSAASYPYIFCNTPCQKNVPPFFRLSSIRKSFSRSLLCRKFLLFLNKYANYPYRRNWNLPVNPVRPCPWFYGGERQIVRLATPILWLSFLTSQHLNFQFPITSLLKLFVRSRGDWKEKMPGRILTCIKWYCSQSRDQIALEN